MVVAHSFGGIVALAWALEFDDLSSVVSVAGVANPWHDDLGWLYRMTGSAWGGAVLVPVISAFVPRRFINSTIDSIFVPQAPPDGYVEHLGPALTLRRESMRANARQVNWLYPHVVEMSQQYGAISVSVEIVHGDADTIVPLGIHSAKPPNQIKGTNLTVFKGVGHMPHHSNPYRIIDVIDGTVTPAGLP